VAALAPARERDDGEGGAQEPEPGAREDHEVEHGPALTRRPRGGPLLGRLDWPPRRRWSSAFLGHEPSQGSNGLGGFRGAYTPCPNGGGGAPWDSWTSYSGAGRRPQAISPATRRCAAKACTKSVRAWRRIARLPQRRARRLHGK